MLQLMPPTLAGCNLVSMLLKVVCVLEHLLLRRLWVHVEVHASTHSTIRLQAIVENAFA